MTTTRIGVLTAGAAVPSIPLAIAQLSACLAPLLANASQLSAAIANPLTIPDLASYLAGLNAAITNALAALAALPGLTITMKASLSGQLGILTALTLAAQALITTLTGAVSAGGIAAYAFDGSVGNIGGELQPLVNGDFPISSAHANALILMTANPATWTAMGALLRTS